MFFVFALLIVICSVLWYGLFTAQDVDTCLSKELAALEFKDFKYKQ